MTDEIKTHDTHKDKRRLRVRGYRDENGEEQVIRIKRPKKKGGNYRIIDDDLAWLYFLDNIGGAANTSLLHAYLPSRKSLNATQKRLLVLHDELELLDRPRFQKRTEKFRVNEVVHEISAQGKKALAARFMKNENVPLPSETSNSFVHNAAQSIIAGWFWVNSLVRNWTFTPMGEVTNKRWVKLKKCRYRWDNLFKVKTDTKHYLGILEVDRGTEQLYETDLTKAKAKAGDFRQTIEGKIRNIKELIGTGLYKTEFNHDKPAISLWVTVSKVRQRQILEVIAHVFPKGCNFIAVTYCPEFAYDFETPEHLDMLGRPWARCGREDFVFI